MNGRLGAVAVLAGSLAIGAAVLGLAVSSSGDEALERGRSSTARTQSEGSVFGFADLDWRVRHNGFGEVSTSQERCAQVDLRPRSAASPETTHAALAITTDAVSGPVRLEMRTVEQLRRPDPNPWEVAWFIWGYQDDQHFYYFTVKPNGWELGKADPAYPGSQRFLATGDEPRAEVDEWIDVTVDHEGADMSVQVGGREVVTFVDEERPYAEGALGMYTEDAHVQFRSPGC